MENWWLINFKKSKNIAYGTSLKAAIEMTSKEYASPTGEMPLVVKQDKEMKKEIIGWRNFFLKEWETWYLAEFPNPEARNERERKIQADYRTDNIQ